MVIKPMRISNTHFNNLRGQLKKEVAKNSYVILFYERCCNKTESWPRKDLAIKTAQRF